MAETRIGTSGFSYQHWRGVFYSEGLPEKRWLEFYAGEFDTVELNMTFYRLPTEAAVRGWARRVPETFLYAAKLSRLITHLKRLRGVGEPLALFLARMKPLGNRLGPILVQLPPAMHIDIPRLDDFLAQCDPDRRWAVEFRHPSWLIYETFNLLAKYRAALCIHDIIPDHPQIITAPFTYLRFHGTEQRYAGNYPDDQLHAWAEKMRVWRKEGTDIYAYFNNDIRGYAVQNARTLRSYFLPDTATL